MAEGEPQTTNADPEPASAAEQAVTSVPVQPAIPADASTDLQNESPTPAETPEPAQAPVSTPEVAKMPEPTLETRIRMADQQQDPQKQKVVRRRGGLGIGCSCRAIGCLVLFLLVALVVGVVILFATRPQWFKDYLNAGVIVPEYDGTTAESAYSRIALQFTGFGIGENDLVISQDQVQAIVADQFGRGLKVDLIPNSIKIMQDIDGGETPLWLVMDVEIDENRDPSFRNIGFQRVGLPSFMNSIFSEIILSVAGVVTNDGQSFLGAMLNLPGNVVIRDVRILNDQMIVTLEVTTGLDNLFQR